MSSPLMSRSPSSSGMFLPLPGSPASSWAVYRARFAALLHSQNTRVFAAFWLFGLINNVLYVIILSAAQDLVGTLPKGIVLLADVLPSFTTKLVAPYFIHRVPYAARVPFLAILSSFGVVLTATTPSEAPVSVKLVGVALASISSGAGELSFLGLTHYYGPLSLAAWGSGTGAAGLAGAGLYVVLTDWLRFTVRTSLLASAVMPVVMLVSFFMLLPREPLRHGVAAAVTAVPKNQRDAGEYEPVSSRDVDEEEAQQHQHEHEQQDVMSALLEQPPAPAAAAATAAAAAPSEDGPSSPNVSFAANLRRARALFFPYMLPLLLVYVAEYTINQGVTPTLLFPLDQSPFSEYRAFYPFYGFLYQLGVFISRSSTPFFRIHHLYRPSLLQVVNLAILTAQALFFDRFLPSVYLVFAIIFWEGLLGGAVYVNTFAEIMERIPPADREFSLGATSVSDSGGICLAAFIGTAMEVGLCSWQVRHGRDWCRTIKAS